MKKYLLFVVMSMFFFVPGAFAVPGKAFLQQCRTDDVNSVAYLRCSSYVIGVIDNMRANKAGKIGFENICIPDSVNEMEVMVMTLKYLESHPDSWDMWAAFAVTMAMSENYKCGCK